jgi:FAD:protein FMN transferase
MPHQFFVVLLTVLCLAACSRPVDVVLNGHTMGTTYQVKVFSQRVDKNLLQQQMDQELVRINQMMSTYIPDSELSRLNRATPGEKLAVSAELIEVLDLSRQTYEASDGAFDVTVGPLVNLWGFGPENQPERIPDDLQIDEARSRMGLDGLIVDGSTVARRTDLYIDLSGIAKGYAADQLSDLLTSQGLVDHMVEIGGELRASGTNARGSHWVIAIEKPVNLARSIFTTLPLKNLGMATSGDYRNYREVDGLRFSHTIDPRTGRPIDHQLASVTVLHQSAALADALATAINVVGPEEGMSLAERQKLMVLFIIRSGDGFEEQRSPELEAYVERINGNGGKT